jgi:glycosyltransferase involved in cell wall biosynthesis
MKILIIDNLYQPNKAGKIANGAQKYTRQQATLLSEIAEVHYVTAAGSDIQYPNQYVLEGFFDLSLEEKSDKVKQTKAVAAEIKNIIHKIEPDVILDSSCKHMSALWSEYPSGSIVFEHYHRPSMVLSHDAHDKFSKKNIYWCGVSKFQSGKFNDYFDDTICIHYVEEYPETVKPAQPYGMFLARWDAGKAPHVALKNYLRSGCQIPIKCFIKYGGGEIPEKVLNELKASPLLTFEIDAPRERILEAMSESSFALSAGNESTGIVSLEFASYGVPYIVNKAGPVAEQEHLPQSAIYLAPTPEDILESVLFCQGWTFEDRKDLSAHIIGKFDKEHFIEEHLRVIKNAKEMYPKGFLECLM